EEEPADNEADAGSDGDSAPEDDLAAEEPESSDDAPVEVPSTEADAGAPSGADAPPSAVEDEPGSV
ncbi:hypothetical protein, partial [Microbacterium sp. UBA3394]